MASSARSKRLKPISRETRFLRLRALKCFKEAHQRLMEGWSSSKVAAFIQDDCKEYTDVGRPSLETQLSEYRASLPTGTVVKERLPRFHAEQAAKVAEGFNELAEMEKLYKMQIERIDIDFTTEKNIGKLMPSMTQEMRAAREILSDIAQLKMDLGVNERHLGKMDIQAKVVEDVASRYDPAVSKVMGNPESRRKLLGIADRFLTLASGIKEESAEPPPIAAAPEPEVEVAPEPARAQEAEEEPASIIPEQVSVGAQQ